MALFNKIKSPLSFGEGLGVRIKQHDIKDCGAA